MNKHNLIEYLNNHEISLGLTSDTSELRFISDTVGHGRFATKDIKKGDIIYRIGGMWLTEKERSVYKQDYFHLVNDAWHFQGGLKYWLNGCHNHSCNPTAYLQENLITALRDINIDEQITLDYAGFIDHNYTIIDKCSCGEAQCRKHITGKDWLTHQLPEVYNYRVSGTILTKWLQYQKT